MTIAEWMKISMLHEEKYSNRANAKELTDVRMRCEAI